MEALDLPRLETVLAGLKSGDVAIEEVLRGLKTQGEWDGGGGSAAAGEEAKADGDGVHKVPPSSASAAVSDATISHLRTATQTYLRHHLPPGSQHTLILTDGFLLLGHSQARLRALFDAKILLRASYADARGRRAARKAYVTLDGFWEDPEGYFEGVVWPAWAEEHAWLFEGGDVQGVVVGGNGEGGCGRERIWVAGVGWGVEEVLGWGVEVLRRELVGGGWEGGVERGG